MSFIPLRQEVTIVKCSIDDGWGQKMESERIKVKARMTEMFRNSQASGGENSVYAVNAESVHDGGKIYLEGLVDITINDKIEYTDELGRTEIFTPLKIEVKRWINGKPLFTIITL